MKIQDVDARLLTLMILCKMREPRREPASVMPTTHKVTAKSKRVSSNQRRARRASPDVERE